MKKIFTVLLVLIIAMVSVYCFAEEESFYAGTYYVGRDFRPGNYNIRVKKTSDADPSAFIEIFKDAASFPNGESIAFDSFSYEGYHLSVTEGMVFHIMVFDCTLTIVNETPSWMITNN